VGLFTDIHTVLMIFTVVFMFYIVYSKIQNRLVATLVLMLGLYYIFFYNPTLWGLLAVMGILIMFHGLNMVQDLIFQYDSATRAESEFFGIGAGEEIERMRKMQQEYVQTPYGMMRR